MSLAVTLFRAAQRSGIPFGNRPGSGDVHTHNRNFRRWYRYEILKRDAVRNRAYAAAIRRCVGGKAVVEHGTGSYALLAVMCARAGARKVYAIEANPEACRGAARVVDRLGLGGTIEIVSGYSTEVRLPEPCDVLVQDILGSIGSSEGAVGAIEDARARHLTPDAEFLPCRATTVFAPVSPFRFSPLSRALNTAGGMPCRIREAGRYNIFNFPRRLLLAEPRVFEDLDFTRAQELRGARQASFRFDRSDWFDGFVLFLRLRVDETEQLDALTQHTNWAAVYVRVLDAPVPVRRGAAMTVESVRDLAGIAPRYRLRVAMPGEETAGFPLTFEWRGC